MPIQGLYNDQLTLWMKPNRTGFLFHHRSIMIVAVVVLACLTAGYALKLPLLMYIALAGLISCFGWALLVLKQNQHVCEKIVCSLDKGVADESLTSNNPMLQMLIAALHDNQNKTARLNAMVGNVSENLANNAEEIAITAKVISEQMHMQTQRVQDIHQRIEKMQQAFSNSIVTAEQTVDVASQSEKEGNSGKLVMTEAMSSISALVDSVQVSGKRVRELGNVSESISGIINVIKGVAEQTNLLALNAAIEAARAGEQGRGFAVVADEVRSLASKTQQYANEIQDIISDLIQQVNQTETEIKSTVDLAQKSDEHIEGVVMSYSEIVGYMLEVNKLGESLAMTTKNEKVSSSDIYAMIDEIKVIGETTKDNISNLASASAELGKLGEQLDMIASDSHNKKSADEIDLF